MELKFLPNLIRNNRKIFLNLKKPTDQYYLLNEILICEIVLNYKKGVFFSSSDIQKLFEKFFLSNTDVLPAKYFEINKTAKKTKIRIQLNNLLSSNIKNNKIIGTRKEVIVDKRKKDNFFIANEEIFDFFRTPITMFDMVLFNKKFPFILNFFKIVNKDNIDFLFKIKNNSIKSFCPLAVERINGFEQVINEYKEYLIKGE